MGIIKNASLPVVLFRREIHDLSGQRNKADFFLAVLDEQQTKEAKLVWAGSIRT